ncbi:MAG: hypothetical protein Q7T44_07965 [Parvibaculum sp.]|nr:hypothetical protein [Parvibaculum sp.]
MTQKLAGFHDAELVGLDANRNERSLSLRFRRVDNSVSTLHIEGVSAFRITDFVNQNVVSRLLESSSYVFSKDEISRQVEWLCSLSDSVTWATGEKIDLIQKEISEGSLLLLVLEPSCGAEFAALARSYSLY